MISVHNTQCLCPKNERKSGHKSIKSNYRRTKELFLLCRVFGSSFKFFYFCVLYAICMKESELFLCIEKKILWRNSSRTSPETFSNACNQHNIHFSWIFPHYSFTGSLEIYKMWHNFVLRWKKIVNFKNFMMSLANESEWMKWSEGIKNVLNEIQPSINNVTSRHFMIHGYLFFSFSDISFIQFCCCCWFN